MRDAEIAKAMLEAMQGMSGILQGTGAHMIRIEISYGDEGLDVVIAGDDDRLRRVGQKVLAMLAQQSEKQSRKKASA